MRKKTVLLGIILSMIFLLTGCGIVFGGETLGDEITITETLTCDEANSIKIDVSSADVNVVKEDRNDIYIEFKTYENGQKLRTKEGVNTIIETYQEELIRVVSLNVDYKLTVYIPTDYDRDIDFNLSSGSIAMNDSVLNNIGINMSSGNVDFRNVEASNINLELSSGDVDFKRVKVDLFEVDMSSGNVDLEEFTGKIKGAASSGSFSVSYKDRMDDLDFEATSGNVNIDYTDVSVDATFDLRKTSGDFDVDLELEDYKSEDYGDKISGILGQGTYEVRIEITSGDVDIK